MTQTRIPLDKDCLITAEAGHRLAGSRDWSVRKDRLTGGTAEGVDIVSLDSGVLHIRVLPTRGMGIWDAIFWGDATYAERRVGWQSPAVRRPVHPAFVPLEAGGGTGWLRGFNELIARCGIASNGPPGADPDGNPLESPLTLHGRIQNLPAHDVVLIIDDEGPGRLTLEGTIDEAFLFGTHLRLTARISLEAGGQSLQIEDTITNTGATPAESQLLYHINLGSTLLEEGSRLAVGAKRAAPQTARAAEGVADWQTCGPPQTGFAEQVYLFNPAGEENDEGLGLLRNAAGDFAASIHFDRRTLPCLSVWKNLGALEDGYVVGIEPATNYPNHRSFERSQGRVVQLAPGEARTTRVRLAIHNDREEIARLEQQAAAICEAAAFVMERVPREDWSPG